MKNIFELFKEIKKKIFEFKIIKFGSITFHIHEYEVKAIETKETVRLKENSK